MISFWITYGKQKQRTFSLSIGNLAHLGMNYIGGTGANQSQAAWRVPIALQLVPAITLGVGILFMPFSPRWLVNHGRDDEALEVLRKTRNLPPDSDLIQIEFLYAVLNKVCLIADLAIGKSRRPIYLIKKSEPPNSPNIRMAVLGPVLDWDSLTTSV
jgi:hypothetical protein